MGQRIVCRLCDHDTPRPAVLIWDESQLKPFSTRRIPLCEQHVSEIEELLLEIEFERYAS